MAKNPWKKENLDLSLLDEAFLAELSEQKEREIYARISSLDINENPIETIEGKVTGGSVNIDGSSVVRRSCNLTMISDQIDINDFYWGIKTKFKLEIGLRNNLTGEYSAAEGSIYPDIIWFPQGIFLISGFNTSISTSSCTISVSGKDKMSMLNGELGGQLFASIDFGTEEVEEKIMKKTTIDASSSDTIMANQYFFIPLIENCPNVIYSNNSKYMFVLDNENGQYYKNGIMYIKNTYTNTGNDLSIMPLTGRDKGSKYKVYQSVTSPSQLYSQVTFSENKQYETGKYYYRKYIREDNQQKEIEYYVLDNASKVTDGRDYYELVDLYEVDYERTITKIPLEKIIRESVHAYAQEPYHNIIINDLEDYGLEQISYKGDTPLIAFRNYSTGHFTNMALLKNIQVAGSYFNFDDEDYMDNIRSELTFGTTSVTPDSLTSNETNVLGTVLYLDSVNKQYIIANESSLNDVDYRKNCYTMAVFVYGDDIGYRVTDLTYAGDLISSIGDNLTSMLDKIKTMLGDFEYFYDNVGHFIFQRKRTYVNTSWSQLTDSDDETYVDYVNSDRQKFSFNFEGNRLISAIQNSPALNNLKNDFVVWGKRKTVSGAEVPIHARYAIDKKPLYYQALNGQVYTVDEKYAQNIFNFSYEDATSVIIEHLKEFTPQYNLPNIDGLDLVAPTRRADGSWTSGWWDIRDWAAYYELLTEKKPLGTMKFYSQNNADGCVSIRSLGSRFNSYSANSMTWLITISSNNVISFGHGSGPYEENTVRNCTYYESEYDSEAHIVKVNNSVVAKRTDRTEFYHAPYSGCSDNHTYLYFLNLVQSQNTRVYFYNPDFSVGTNITYEEIIQQSAQELYEEWLQQNRLNIVDWREIIYQMALDYFAGQGCSEENPIYDVFNNVVLTSPDHFLSTVAANNPDYYPTGYTGYEQYYTDMEGFWRQLYNPEYVPDEIFEPGVYEEKIEQANNSIYFKRYKDWNDPQLVGYNTEYYFDGKRSRINDQTLEYINYQLEHAETQDEIDKYKKLKNKFLLYYVSSNDTLDKQKRLYWNKDVFESPESLNFWIDFFDSGTELAQFAISMVGDRTKVVNEDKASSIIFKEIPDIILCDKFADSDKTSLDYSNLRKEITANSGYTFVYLPKGFSQYLNLSYRNISVKNKIDELLYQFAYCIENITITALPVYHLQPNTRIYVRDEKTHINGEYIVNRISLSLAYNGTMSITAVKAPERLY